MSKELNILINALIDEELNKKSINKQLKRIQSNINKLKVNVVIDDKITKTLNDFSKQFKKIEQQAMNAGKVIEEVVTPDGTKVKRTHFDGVGGEFKQIIKQAKDTKQTIEKSTDAFDAHQGKVKDLENQYKTLATSVEKYNKSAKKIGQTDTYTDDTRSRTRKINYDGKGNFQGYTDTDNELKRIKDREKVIKDLTSQIEKLRKTGSHSEKTLESLTNRIDKVSSEDDVSNLKGRIKLLNDARESRIARNKVLEEEYKIRARLNKVQSETDQKNREKALQEEQKIRQRLEKEEQKQIENREKILKEEQKIRNAIDQKKKKTEEQNKNLQHQLNLYKQQAQINQKNLKRRYGDNADTNALKDYLSNVQQLTVDTPDLKKKMDNLNMSFRNIKESVASASSHTVTFGEQLKIALTRFPIWMTAATMFYAPLRIGQQLVETLILIDDQLISIEKVSSSSNMDQVLDSARESAYELGRTLDGALASYEQIAKMGFNQQETQTLSNNAMLLSTVGDMADKDAANYLVASMKQYRIEVEDTLDVVNAWNELSNNSGTTSEALAQSMAKAGSAARNAGITFHEFNAMTAVLTESLKITGKEAGNSLKAFSNRVLRENVRDELETVGIKTKETNGALVSATDILAQLGEKWNEYSAEQRNAISQSLGGVYHINKVNALIEQQKDIVENTSHSMNSYMSAQKELETFQQGLTYQINQMKLSFQELAIVLGQNGVRDLFLGIVESITSMTRWFTDVTEATHAWNIKLPILTGLLFGVVKGIQSASAALVTLTTTGRIAMSAFGWIGLAATGLSILVPTLIGSAKASKINAEALEKQSQEYGNQATEIERLIARYDELKPQAEINRDKQKELEQVLQEIHRIAPHVIEDTNNYGDALLINKDKANEYIESLRTLSKEQLQQAKQATEIKIIQTQTDIDDLEKDLNKAQKKVQEAFDFIRSYQDKYDVSGLLDAEGELSSRIDNLTDQYREMTITTEEFNVARNEAYKEFHKYKDAIEDEKGVLGEHTETVDEFNEKQAELKGLQDRNKALEDQINSTSNATKETDSLNESMAENEEANQNVAQSSEDLSDVYNDYTKSISSINKYLEEYQENNSLSADSINEIILKYPHLLQYINDEAELIRRLGLEKQAQVETAIDAKMQELEASEAFYQTLLPLAEDYFNELGNGYEIDLKNYSTMEQAKAKMTSKLISSLAQSWSQYFGMSAKQMKDFIGKNNLIDTETGQLTATGADYFKWLPKDQKDKLMNEFNSQYKIIQGFQDLAESHANLPELSLNLDKIGISLDKVGDKASKSGKKLADSTKKAKEELEEKTYVVDKYKNEMEKLNFLIEEQQRLQSDVPDFSNDYQEALEREIELLKKKKEAIDAEIEAVKSQIKTKDLEERKTTSYNNSSSSYTGGSPSSAKGNNHWSDSSKLNEIHELMYPNKGSYNGKGFYSTRFGFEYKPNAAYSSNKSIQKQYGITSRLKESIEAFEAVKQALASDDLEQLRQAMWKAHDLESSMSRFGTKNHNMDGHANSLLSTELAPLRVAFELARQRYGKKKYGEGYDGLGSDDLRGKGLGADYLKDKGIVDHVSGRYHYDSKYFDDGGFGQNSGDLGAKIQSQVESTVGHELANFLDSIDYSGLSPELKEQVDNLKSDLVKLHSERDEASQQIKQLQYELIVEVNKARFDAELDDIEHLYDTSAEKIKEFKKGTKDYNSEINNQYGLIKRKISITEEEIEHVTQLIEQNKGNAKITHALSERYEDLAIATVRYKNDLRDLRIEQKKFREDIADDIVDIYKDIYRKQEKVAMNAIDREINALEKAHNTKINMLDDELSKYEETVNEKLRIIDRQTQDEDYEKELKKAQDKKISIQKQIDVLSLDNSLESQARRIELEQELSDIILDIEAMKDNRVRELRKRNLRENLDAKRKETQEEKENLRYTVRIHDEASGKIIKIKNKTYEEAVKLINKEKENWNRYYENLINDERAFNKIREDVMDGYLGDVRSKFESFKAFLEENSDIIGESLKENLIDKINAFGDKLQEIDGMELNGINSQFSEIADVLLQMKQNSDAWWSATESQRTTLEQANAALRQQLQDAGYDVNYDSSTGQTTVNGQQPYTTDNSGGSSNTSSGSNSNSSGSGSVSDNTGNGIVNENDHYLDLVDSGKSHSEAQQIVRDYINNGGTYHEGGVIGSKTNKLTSLVNKIFNTNPSEQVVKALKGELMIPPKNIPNGLKNIQNALSSTQTPTLSTGDTNFHLSFHVDKITGDESGGKQVFNTIVTELKKRGKKI